MNGWNGVMVTISVSSSLGLGLGFRVIMIFYLGYHVCCANHISFLYKLEEP